MTDATPTIQLLFPMGGLGSRFAKAGIPTPKPLIPVDGVPMIVKAISSFEALLNDEAAAVKIRHIFIVRTEHEGKDQLKTKLGEAVPGAEFVMLDHDTKGAVETCLVAEPAIDPRYPIVVMDCDLWFNSRAYLDVLVTFAKSAVAAENSAEAKKNPFKGLLLYFESSAPRYSFAAPFSEEESAAIVTQGPAELSEVLKREPGPRFLVKKTAEKVPISNSALIGAYGFATGALFVEAGKQLLASLDLQDPNSPKEYYVSLLYNFLLNGDGGSVIAVPRDDYHSFGTPEELTAYNEGKQSHVDQ